MPKNQNTAGKRARAAARSGAKYTAALREQEAGHGQSAERRAAESLRDRRERQLLEQAADPGRRAWYLVDRFRQATVRGLIIFNNHPGGGDLDRAQFLNLIYSTVLADRPGLRPDPAVMAAAVAAGDLDAVNAAIAPLDRAARLFLAQQPETYAAALGAHAARLMETTGQAWQSAHALGSYWYRAHAVRTGWDGYPTNRGVPYRGVCHTLDAALVAHYGGHAPGQAVRLHDERTAYVLDCQWWDDDDRPTGYTLVPTGPGPEFDVRADLIAAEE